jgi:D-alanyl-D-alanine dipeptidase
MANNIVNNYCSTVVTIFQDVKKNYENNIEIIDQAEEELNDLYHECELADPKDMYNGWKVYKAIREVRIRRRNAKQENEMLKDMYEYLNSQAGQTFKTKMQSIQSSAAKIQTAQESRTYRPRQRNDLTIADKHSTATKPFEQMLKEFNQTKVTMQGGKLRK